MTLVLKELTHLHLVKAAVSGWHKPEQFLAARLIHDCDRVLAGSQLLFMKWDHITVNYLKRVPWATWALLPWREQELRRPFVQLVLAKVAPVAVATLDCYLREESKSNLEKSLQNCQVVFDQIWVGISVHRSTCWGRRFPKGHVQRSALARSPLVELSNLMVLRFRLRPHW